MTSTNIDDVDTYFEFRIFTKIHSEPSYETLKAITNQLKSNTCGVTSDLDGGTHGHLGLIMTPTEYATISLVPYISPTHPGALTISSGTAKHEAKHLRKDHIYFTRNFCETTDVEKSLIKQIVDALEPKYIGHLRDANSNPIMMLTTK